jgi:HEPN domain-containing protein
MYQEKLKYFENIENLGGKAWEHAVTLDILNESNIKDCSIHCFHYQQMMELLVKHLLETRSEFGSYSRTYKLQKLLEELIANTAFKTDQYLRQ